MFLVEVLKAGTLASVKRVHAESHMIDGEQHKNGAGDKELGPF